MPHLIQIRNAFWWSKVLVESLFPLHKLVRRKIKKNNNMSFFKTKQLASTNYRWIWDRDPKIFTLRLTIMVHWRKGPFNMSFVSFRAIFYWTVIVGERVFKLFSCVRQIVNHTSIQNTSGIFKKISHFVKPYSLNFMFFLFLWCQKCPKKKRTRRTMFFSLEAKRKPHR